MRNERGKTDIDESEGTDGGKRGVYCTRSVKMDASHLGGRWKGVGRRSIQESDKQMKRRRKGKRNRTSLILYLEKNNK